MGGIHRKAGSRARPRLTPLSRLEDRIARLIEANGPLTVADYMAICLYDPDDGYYTTREPFGVAGDFVTAPEVSQMFGELVAVWLLAVWRALGKPLPTTLAEIGPGRGTLMKDMLRALGRVGPEFAARAGIAMVEKSPRLAAIQNATLGTDAARIEWHGSLDGLPGEPLFVVANELFDAIPIRQYVKSEGQWRERAVGLNEAGGLVFVAAAGAPDPSLLPPGAAAAPDGAIVELAPARAALMEKIAGRIAAVGGAALLIDYGHARPAVGDSLQALSRHAHADPLAAPGRADLTAHVDFSALAHVARSHGLQARLATQGDFLLGMGLIERAGQLGANAGAATRKRLQDEVDRLAGADGMGTLFKVLAVAPRGIALPAFPASD
jgi:SAM-dependent MidA family methyltransferase